MQAQQHQAKRINKPETRHTVLVYKATGIADFIDRSGLLGDPVLGLSGGGVGMGFCRRE